MFYKLNKLFYTALLLPTAALAAGVGVYACGGSHAGRAEPPDSPANANGAARTDEGEGLEDAKGDSSASEGRDGLRDSAETPQPSSPPGALVSVGPGFPESGPWMSFYGPASKMKDVARAAHAYRIINIDADPDNDGESNFTDAQLEILRAGGKNKVLSYLDIGSCEKTRSYWSHAPAPFVACGKNKAAQLGAYAGYADEMWMDPSNADYQTLVVDFVAARLAARKVDGFYLDNLEIVEHPKSGANGPCSAQCKQGGLDIVKRLRDKFPDSILVMQNATGRTTRLGVTGGVRFATLLDGIAHEEVYAPRRDANAEAELLAWKQMNIRTRTGRPFWIATEDYVGSCANERAARDAWTRSQRNGFSPYVSDESSGQSVVCYWRF